jgi:hypothetical protein
MLFYFLFLEKLKHRKNKRNKKEKGEIETAFQHSLMHA